MAHSLRLELAVKDGESHAAVRPFRQLLRLDPKQSHSRRSIFICGLTATLGLALISFIGKIPNGKVFPRISASLRGKERQSALLELSYYSPATIAYYPAYTKWSQAQPVLPYVPAVTPLVVTYHPPRAPVRLPSMISPPQQFISTHIDGRAIDSASTSSQVPENTRIIAHFAASPPLRYAVALPDGKWAPMSLLPAQRSMLHVPMRSLPKIPWTGEEVSPELNLPAVPAVNTTSTSSANATAVDDD